ncbi:MAG: hypothetical protein JW917_10750 [Ignavibacteria bacterium]|nr:hypothetical protein [Ignavibacteria bacterium]
MAIRIRKWNMFFESLRDCDSLEDCPTNRVRNFYLPLPPLKGDSITLVIEVIPAGRDSLEDCPTRNVIFMNPCGIETVWKTVLPGM